MIIEVRCTKCNKKQKMEVRQPKLTVFNHLDLTNKRKKCVWCEKSFKITKDNII
ncbi:hypothetical protein HOF78_01180 [Candidatus Woesearchaeota archaeon]|jgi:hypothetical protein|nr:hypothetical protein [Candidatus Woesearchaeota archaeon]MBT6045005.1 hypothetical protein [Candidatus Woesearchaeota archaeon]